MSTRQTNGRDRYVEVGAAMRETIARAGRAGLGAFQRAVLDAVLARTAAWSQLDDTATLAVLARLALGLDDDAAVPAWRLEKVRAALVSLDDGDVIRVIFPGSRSGRPPKALGSHRYAIALPAVETPPVTGGVTGETPPATGGDLGGNTTRHARKHHLPPAETPPVTGGENEDKNEDSSEGGDPGEPAARTGRPAGGTSNPREEDPSLVDRAGALVPRRYRAEVSPIVEQLVAERGEPAVDQALAIVEQTGARFGFPSTLRDDLERRIADRPAPAAAPSPPSSTTPAGVSDGDTCPTHEVWSGICGCSTKPAPADVDQQTRNLAAVRHARRRLGPAQPRCRKCGDTRYLGPTRQRFACTYCNADSAAPDSACPTCGMSPGLCACDDQSDDLGRQEAQP